MKSDFFKSNTYFLDEKSRNSFLGNPLFSYVSTYQIYDEQGDYIGVVKPNEKRVKRNKMWKWFFTWDSLPLIWEIRNSDDKIEAFISRGFYSFGKFTVKDPQGAIIGEIKQKLSFRQIKYILRESFWIILDASKVLISEIFSEESCTTFRMNDAYNNQLGLISLNLNWSGSGEMKGGFTATYKYKLHIEDDYSNSTNKLLLLSFMVCHDELVFKGDRDLLISRVTRLREKK